jgi:hypothetical protein
MAGPLEEAVKARRMTDAGSIKEEKIRNPRGN